MNSKVFNPFIDVNKTRIKLIIIIQKGINGKNIGYKNLLRKQGIIYKILYSR